MLKTVQDSFDKFDFTNVSDLSKEEFANILSTVLEDFAKSDDFAKISIKHVLTAMNNKF